MKIEIHIEIFTNNHPTHCFKKVVELPGQPQIGASLSLTDLESFFGKPRLRSVDAVLLKENSALPQAYLSGNSTTWADQKRFREHLLEHGWEICSEFTPGEGSPKGPR
jgi:hypothetical protein